MARITGGDARSLANMANKDQVVIIAIKAGDVQVEAWGRSLDDKVKVAGMADSVADVVREALAKGWQPK